MKWSRSRSPAQLDTDDAVALIEDLDQDDQLAILRAMEPDDRAAVEEALTYGEDRRTPDAARPDRGARALERRPGHRLHAQDRRAATDFWEVFVVAPNHHPVGTCKLSTILRSPRSVPIGEIMVRKQTLIPVDMDQEEVALKFQKYALISAAVVDSSGRLVGMITVDDIVHIIQKPARRAAAVRRGRGRHQRAGVRHLSGAGPLARRQPADRAGGLAGDQPVRSSIERMAVLAALMPIVAGVGGNAGTDAGGDGARHRDQPADRFQPLARRLARNPGRADERPDHRRADRHRRNGRARLGRLGGVIAAAMLTNIVIAGLAGVLVPLGLERAGADPAVALERVRDDGDGFDGVPGLPWARRRPA